MKATMRISCPRASGAGGRDAIREVLAVRRKLGWD